MPHGGARGKKKNYLRLKILYIEDHGGCKTQGPMAPMPTCPLLSLTLREPPLDLLPLRTWLSARISKCVKYQPQMSTVPPLAPPFPWPPTTPPRRLA